MADFQFTRTCFLAKQNERWMAQVPRNTRHMCRICTSSNIKMILSRALRSSGATAVCCRLLTKGFVEQHGKPDARLVRPAAPYRQVGADVGVAELLAILQVLWTSAIDAGILAVSYYVQVWAGGRRSWGVLRPFSYK